MFCTKSFHIHPYQTTYTLFPIWTDKTDRPILADQYIRLALVKMNYSHQHAWLCVHRFISFIFVQFLSTCCRKPPASIRELKGGN